MNNCESVFNEHVLLFYTDGDSNFPIDTICHKIK